MFTYFNTPEKLVWEAKIFDRIWFSSSEVLTFVLIFQKLKATDGRGVFGENQVNVYRMKYCLKARGECESFTHYGPF